MWRKRIATKILSRRFIGNNDFYSDLPPADAPPPAVSDESFLGSNGDTQFTIVDHLQETYRIQVCSWNVGGLLPTKDLDIRDCLNIQNDPADVYIFGFQEIVPLGAVNVLSTEDGKVSSNWNALIRESLKKTSSSTPNNDHNHDSESSKELQKIYPMKEHKSNYSSSFKCITSKQMVGIFVSVWVKTEIANFIRGQSVACVGCGTFGCLGNKGSVSVRFWLHETSFCFVCCHLASGGKEGDEKHRNADAADILSRTTFPIGPSSDELPLPREILDHDEVIWFGDLNYRINLPEETTRSLAENEEWEFLLRNDQLNVELKEGHVLEGWEEGKIDFGPTYKYYPNSNVYFGSNKNGKGQKSRAPAWCDRIIWCGKGLKQEQYVKGDSKLSDHRPVQAIFTAQVELSGRASIGT